MPICPRGHVSRFDPKAPHFSRYYPRVEGGFRYFIKLLYTENYDRNRPPEGDSRRAHMERGCSAPFGAALAHPRKEKALLPAAIARGESGRSAAGAATGTGAASASATGSPGSAATISVIAASGT